MVRSPHSPSREKPLHWVASSKKDYHGDAYRAVYTVRFAEVVYVLHAFQKKSKVGIKTPQDDMNLISERLRRAQQDYERTRSL